MTQISFVDLCNETLTELGWTWEHPRLVDWLARAGKKTRGQPYTARTTMPDFVWISLAKFLDLRLKCHKLLNQLGWDWNHEKVLEIQRRYRCVGQLPMKGYEELYRLLEDELFFNKMPF